MSFTKGKSVSSTNTYGVGNPSSSFLAPLVTRVAASNAATRSHIVAPVGGILPPQDGGTLSTLLRELAVYRRMAA